MTTNYSIRRFIADAKQILAGEETLDQKKELVGERMQELSRRDDLVRHGAPHPAGDASSGTYLLWREPPHLSLLIAHFDPYFQSPVHEHADHWVIVGSPGTELEFAL